MGIFHGPRKYDKQVVVALRKVWVICDCICGKRLGPYLAEIVPLLERLDEIKIAAEVRKKLIEVSPATIDRLLAPVRKRYQLRARSNTKPGTLLKHQIPIRTFSDWDELRPGFVEIDLVSHEGGDARGDYIQTLDMTDVCSGWTETQAVKNKAQVWVFEGIEKAKERFPFEILGIDSDNGSEFINNHLLRYCSENKITFTLWNIPIFLIPRGEPALGPTGRMITASWSRRTTLWRGERLVTDATTQKKSLRC